MAETIFIELGIIIVIAIVIVWLMRILKQPLIISYIITGILVSPAVFNVIKSTELITTLADIGIALLLFMVGLNLNPKVIKEVGKVSIITGVGQAIFTALIAYGIAVFLGFSPLTALYISVALTFSSTILITKLLSDKGDIHKLYGRISIGFLFVQDLIAVIALMAVSSVSDKGTIVGFALSTFATGSALLVGLFIFSYYALPMITKSIAKSQEFLLLFSIGWCLLIATLFEVFNLSIEIGALLAGVTLSLSPYRLEIGSKLKPIRDFFIFLFFVWLGSQLLYNGISQYKTAIIVFSLLILIGSPIIMMILMGVLGYKKQTSFMTGLVVAQISEFSHILIALGIKVGHLSSDILSLVTVIGLVTIGGSTYLVIYGDKIYPYLSRYLAIFERKKTRGEEEEKEKRYDIVLFGAHRIGHDILEEFKHRKQSLLVVDYNPDIIGKLSKRGFNCVYGDIADVDLFDDINLCNSKMIISTVPDKEVNLLFLRRAKICNPNAIVLIVANDAEEALELYKRGATYVITPKFIGGKYIADKIESCKFDTKKFMKEQAEHIKHLNRIRNDGV